MTRINRNRRNAKRATRHQRTAEHVARGMAAAERYNARRVEAPPDFDRVIGDDRAFFPPRPDRAHRVRHASAGELAMERAAGGTVPPLPQGHQYATVVRQVVPGMRQRQIIALPLGADLDMGEAEARALWDRGAPAGSAADHMATHFRTAGGDVPEKPPAKAVASFCACLQVGKVAPGYASAEAAMSAVRRFVAGTGLPRAALIVVPGEAVFAAWVLASAPSSAEWSATATLLARLAKHHGLRIAGPIVRELPFDLDALAAELQS